ncbi:MAG: hypothetical protein II399_05370 [Lachnospiraceae bacterium]|nr:hypothetical protein [Lachnospiraceae bacterium]
MAGMFAGLLAMFAMIFSNIAIIGMIFIPLILVMLISFLLPAFALYRHAKTAGYDKPWLAFIPFAQTYLEYVLPRRRFKALFIDTHEREKVALIVILVSTFGTSVIAGLNLIPAFGQILDLALTLFLVAMNWRKMYDYLCTFVDEKDAMTFSVIGVFVPIVYAVYLIVIREKEPEYGAGNYYNVIIPEAREVNDAPADGTPAAQTPVTETSTDNVQ